MTGTEGSMMAVILKIVTTKSTDQESSQQKPDEITAIQVDAHQLHGIQFFYITMKKSSAIQPIGALIMHDFGSFSCKIML